MRTAPAASAYFTAAEISALRRRSNGRGLLLVAHAWTVIAGSMALFANWPNPFTWLLATMLIGSRQLGLLILMHDGAHGMLARTPWLNTVLAQGFCAWPTFADTNVYRRYHLRHHAQTMQPGDPDLVLTGHYPVARASLWRKFRRDLLGLTGFTQRRGQFIAALGGPGLAISGRLRHFWQQLGPQCLLNVMLLAGLSLPGYWVLYPLLWLAPLLSWQQLVLRVRNIAEHAAVPDRNDPLRNARTTRASWIARALVAPYWVNYHLEHHLLMWVPCFRLPRAHALLLAKGHAPRMNLGRGYWQVLEEVTHTGHDDTPRRRAAGTFGAGFAAD